MNTLRTSRLFRALLVFLFLSQLAFLGHLVLDEHEEEVSCEVCLKAQQSEAGLLPVSGSQLFVPLVCVGIFLLTVPLPIPTRQCRYSSRAPPQ